MSQVWMKFYPSDWRADPALRMCSIGARGLWMEMLCVMHEASPRGFLVVNGRPLNNRQLATLAGCSIDDATAMAAELEDAGVFSRTDEGTIYSRRMCRDTEKAAEDKANGAKGGNPKLSALHREGVNPPVKREDKAQKPEARDQILDPTSLRSVGERASAPPAPAVLPEGWEADEPVALSAGVPRSSIGTVAAKFTAHHRSKRTKSADWRASWLKWCIDEAERRGWEPATASAEPRAGPAMIHIDAVSDETAWRAWEAHLGRKLARDKLGGRYVPSRFPPSAQAAE